jgi:hypothetical protein
VVGVDTWGICNETRVLMAVGPFWL